MTQVFSSERQPQVGQVNEAEVYILLCRRYVVSLLLLHSPRPPLSKDGEEPTTLSMLTLMIQRYTLLPILLPTFFLLTLFLFPVAKSSRPQSCPLNLVSRLQCLLHSLLYPRCLSIDPLEVVLWSLLSLRVLFRPSLVHLRSGVRVLPPHYVSERLPVHS